MTTCKECLHLAVCGRYTATGGNVRECKHFVTDNHVGGKWIPVTERLPEAIPCGAGTAYSEAVNVLTSGRKVLTAIFDGAEFIADAEFWEADGGNLRSASIDKNRQKVDDDRR